MLVPCCLVTDVIHITDMNRNIYNLREHLGNKIAGLKKNKKTCRQIETGV